MKNILLLLSLMFVFLLGARGNDAALPETSGKGVEACLQTEAPVGYVLPVVAEWPEEGEAYVDAESLARQFRVCGRNQRLGSVLLRTFMKGTDYRAVQKRLELLFHSFERTYSSLPCQSWPVASDHYVFGMRRILI